MLDEDNNTMKTNLSQTMKGDQKKPPQKDI